jgi:hypothetical protein
MQGSGDMAAYLSYPTLVGHIHLNQIINYYFLFMKVITDMCFILLLHT